MKKRQKGRLEQTPEMLTTLSHSLIDGEQYWREGEARKAFKTYLSVGHLYEELQDFETASYFHQRCLEISTEFKFIEG